MSRTFTANVVLRHPDTLQATSFVAGDEVPEWATVGDHAASNGVTRQTSANVSTPNDPAIATDGATETIVTPQHEIDATDDSDDDDSLPPYEEWSKTDLKAEAKGRELTGYSNATVDELVEMLKADDSENPED